jgi:hypothetical protein
MHVPTRLPDGVAPFTAVGNTTICRLSDKGTNTALHSARVAVAALLSLGAIRPRRGTRPGGEGV